MRRVASRTFACACHSYSEMFSRHYRKVKAIFGFTDSILISLAFVAAYQTRFRLNFEKPFHWVFYIDFRVASLLLLVSLVCWLAIGYWFNIYEKLDSAHPSVVLRDTFRQCLLGAICLVVSEYLLRLDLSRFFVLLFATYSWILLCLFRINAARVIGAVRREFGTAHFVMVVGSSERARHLGRALEQSSAYGIRLMGFLDERPGQVQLSRSYEQFPLSALPELLRRHVIDEIIFAVNSERLSEMEHVFLLCDEEGVRTRVAMDFFPHVNSEIYLDALGTTPLLTFSAAPHDEIRLLLKRITDVTASHRCAGPVTALYASDRFDDPANLARTGYLPAGTLRLEWASVHVLQVPLYAGQCRGDEGLSDASEQ